MSVTIKRFKLEKKLDHWAEEYTTEVEDFGEYIKIWQFVNMKNKPFTVDDTNSVSLNREQLAELCEKLGLTVYVKTKCDCGAEIERKPGAPNLCLPCMFC
ncbi:MAG: hypothetical protein ACFFCW_34990 [Candidatus Hodarchaeota archaeon]